jgi:GNAT superfamily N-acetyltransferase
MNDILEHVEVNGETFTIARAPATHRSVVVMWSGEEFNRGTAEAEQLPTLPDDWWWVNRVLVQPVECRSKGIGSELVRQLSIAAYDLGCRHLVVSPGGYVNTKRDRERQLAFYERNGFVWQDDAPFSHGAAGRVMVLDLGG